MTVYQNCFELGQMGYQLGHGLRKIFRDANATREQEIWIKEGWETERAKQMIPAID